jgi:hypothetical protein
MIPAPQPPPLKAAKRLMNPIISPHTPTKDNEQGYHYNCAIQRIRQDSKTCDNTQNTEKDFIPGIRAIYCQTKQCKQATDKPIGTEYGDQYKESPVRIIKEEYSENQGDNPWINTSHQGNTWVPGVTFSEGVIHSDIEYREYLHLHL